jgi:60 kDa SS-A/Ro ribonucleoprotein
MTNINKVNKMLGTETTTYEGGKAYKLSFKEEIAEFFSLGLLRGTFYQTEEDVLRNARDIFEKALVECPEFATKAAIYGNNVNSLKLVPMIWLAYVSTLDDKTLFKAAFPRIIRNPGMLHSFMELIRKTDIRQGLGRSVKKAMNDWMKDRLNDYQVSRNKNKLAEVIKVTRPAFKDDTFQNYMRYIAKDEITFERGQALKEVIEAISEGVYGDLEAEKVKKHRLQLEELKHATKALEGSDKKRLYKDMYSSLNYAALILNLVALERVYATSTRKVMKYSPERGYFTSNAVVETNIPDDVIELVVNRIRDVEMYRKSNMLPFALMNAEKMVVTPEFKKAISDMFKIASKEAFNIPENVELFMAIDTSGSMTSEMVNEHLTASDVANVFGGMIKKAHPNTETVAVASTCKKVNLRAQDDIFTMAKKIKKTDVGYGTYFEKIMPYYKGQKYTILLTDSMQADDLEAQWLRNKNRPKDAKLIVWQLSAYGLKISKNPSIIYVRGYSDRLLSLVKNVIEDKGTQMEEIEKIQLY